MPRIHLKGPLPLRPVILAGTAIGTLSVFGIGAVRASDDEPMTITCTSDVTYGEAIDCTVTGKFGGSTIDWGDGTTVTDIPDSVGPSGLVRHTPVAVGPLTVSLLNGEGTAEASSNITVTPDLSLTCEAEGTNTEYELVADPASETGWNYVYLHPDTKNRVLPGDDGYPAVSGLTDWEKVVVGEAQVTGKCVATSQAADDLGGSFAMTMTSAWDEPRRLPFSYLVPWAKQHWLGTQPGELTATVTIETSGTDSTDGATIEASERVGIYFSGCS